MGGGGGGCASFAVAVVQGVSARFTLLVQRKNLGVTAQTCGTGVLIVTGLGLWVRGLCRTAGMWHWCPHRHRVMFVRIRPEGPK